MGGRGGGGRGGGGREGERRRGGREGMGRWRGEREKKKERGGKNHSISSCVFTSAIYSYIHLLLFILKRV